MMKVKTKTHEVDQVDLFVNRKKNQNKIKIQIAKKKHKIVFPNRNLNDERARGQS